MPVTDAWLTTHVTVPAHRALLRRIVDGDERLDAAAFATVLTDDAVFRLGGGPATSGRAVIEAQVRSFMTQLRSMRHDLGLVFERPGVLAYEAQVSYVRGDGRPISLPYANVLRVRGDLIHDYRVYIDATPLFAP